MKKVLISILLAVSFMSAASFNCKKASTNIEKAICNNSKLSNLDETLSSIYKENLNIFFNDDKYALIDDQRQWMKNRNKCSSIELTQCLTNTYETRIDELSLYKINYKSNSLTDEVSVKYESKGSSSEAFLEIKQLSTSSFLVYGESLYGINNKYGPNIGTINGIAHAKGNKAILKLRNYTLTLILKENKLEATESGDGGFGMNVSFGGTYDKVVRK